MPNRILREGILTSERVNALSWEAEVFYRRLMSVVDDFGRFSAHLSLLRAALYPLKLDTVRDANLERLLASVVQARLVRVYEVAGKRFLEVLDFRQQARAKESKYPPPPSTCAADATQVPSKRDAPAPVFGDGDGDGDGDGEPPARVRAQGPGRPGDVGEQVWADWVALRKGKRAKVTETAIDAARAEATKAGVPLEEFMRVWCGLGWHGLTAAKFLEQQGKRGVNGSHHEPEWRREQRERNEAFLGPFSASAAKRRRETLEAADAAPPQLG